MAESWEGGQDEPERRPMSAWLHPVVWGLVSILLLSPVGAYVIWLAWEADQRAIRASVLSDLAQVRATLEGRITSSFSLTKGMEALFSVQGDISDSQFHRLSAELLREHPVVRNIGLARGTVLSALYPAEGNQAAIGVDYRDIPNQWPAVRRTIEQRRSTIVGPLDLIQGGRAIIQRTPVFAAVTAPEGGTEPRFLGLISMVLDLERLFGDLFQSNTRSLTIAGRTAVDEDAGGKPLFGDQALFERERNAVLLPLALPIGEWVLAAVPKGGWQAPEDSPVAIVETVVFFSLVGVGAAVTTLSFGARARDSALADARGYAATVQAMIRDAPDAMLFVDRQGVIVRANNQACTLFRWPLEHLIGSPISALVPRGSADGEAAFDHNKLMEDFFRRPSTRRMRSGRVVSALTADGSRVPVEVTLGQTGRGDNLLVSATIRDVSDQVAMEEARQRAEDMLKQALDSIAEGFVVYDENDRLLICNEAYKRIYSISAPVMTPGRTFEEIVRYGVRGGQYPAAGASEATREAFVQDRLRSHRTPDGPILQLTNDGRWIRIEEHRTEQGLLVGLRSDVTALKLAQIALEESESRLRGLLDTSPIGVLLSHLDGRPVYANARFLDLLGLTEVHLADLMLPDLCVDEEEAETLRQLLSRSWTVSDRPVRLRRTDGSHVWVLVTASPAAFHEEGGRVIWIYDITERIRIEEDLAAQRTRAEEATRLKSAFLATVSHELRTPMTGILGLADLLLSGALPPRELAHAERLKGTADHLLVLLNDILDFSKIEAGQLTLEEISFSPAMVLEDVRRVMGVAAEAKGLGFTVESGGDLASALVGDPTRVRQILLNLSANAVKFTDKGSVRLRLRTRPVDGGLIRLDVSVDDTGIGIPEDRLAQLFTPFVQADASINRRFGGTGLGLAISRRLTEMMGGEIRAESVVGMGSRFWLTLTLPAGDPSDVVEMGPSCALPSRYDRTPLNSGMPPARVLLAEDTETVRLVITEALSRFGHRVTAVTDGRKAVDMVKQQTFDVVLMDLHMPDMDGFTAAKTIRGLPGREATIPIIALSADIPAMHAKLREDGLFTDFLDKPVDWRRLNAAIMATFDLSGRIGSGLTGAAPCGPTEPGQPPAPAPSPPSDNAEADLADGDGIDTLPILDLERIGNLLEAVGVDKTAMLLESVIKNLLKTFGGIQAALDGKPAEAVRASAHALKGLTRQFGLVRLGEYAERIETEARSGHLEAAGQITARLEPLIPLAIEHMTATLAEMRSRGAVSQSGSDGTEGRQGDE